MQTQKNQTCCFTGHRIIPKEAYGQIKLRLEKAVLALSNQGITTFAAGGALGFDTLAAQAVLALRETRSEIRLLLALPCKDQPNGWKEADVQTYRHILSLADEVIYESEQYHSGCMYKRNRRLVDESCLCLCYMTKPLGGTVYTVNYAKRSGVAVINLAKESAF